MTEPRIRIVRDVDGVAHVRAATLLDALEGQGYAAAQDRLAQIVLDRRRGLGRLAEVVGPSAVAADAFHRRLDIAGSAQRSFQALGVEAQAALTAYAAGVNRWLADRADDPPELELLDDDPEPWEPWHSVALYQVRHLLMGTFETKVWRSGLVHRLGAAAAARLWPQVPEVTIEPDAEPVVAAASAPDAMALAGPVLALLEGPVGDDAASNNLAIAPNRTSTGAPIVAGDPHRAIDLPNVYWPNHLTAADGSLDVVGLSFAGVPGYPHFAHNGDIAWCITHGMADDQDVYVERLRRAGDSVEWLHDGEWSPVEHRVETITVAGAEPVDVGVVVTGNGPVVTDSPQTGDVTTVLSLRWTALVEPDTTFDCLVPAMRARSVDELDAAYARWVVPVNNVLMADRSGTIAYRMRGRLAIRAKDNGWTAVDGADPDRGWTGLVADDDLFRWRDPAAGFLVTANNRIAADSPSDRPRPYVSHDWAHRARATRLGDRLGERDDWDAASVGALLGDTVSLVAQRFAARIQALPHDPVTASARGLLDGWGGSMDADSPAAALYGITRAELVRAAASVFGLADDVLPGVTGPSLHQRLRFLNARVAFWIDDPDLVTDTQLAAAVRFAVRTLELAQGADPARWRWGRCHPARWVHPLAVLRPDLSEGLTLPPPVELGGDNECVWATSTAPPTTEACNGPVARYVFDLADWDHSRWVLPHGVSGDPSSPHHLDMAEDWAAIRYRPMRFSTEAVDAATESTTDIP